MDFSNPYLSNKTDGVNNFTSRYVDLLYYINSVTTFLSFFINFWPSYIFNQKF